MSKIINLTDGYKRNLEKRAFDEFGAIKLEEDSYIIPANIVVNDEIDYGFEDSKFFKNKKLIRSINKMRFRRNSIVTISCVGILKGGDKVLEVTNVTNEENDINTIVVNGNLDSYEREDLLNLIASYHTGRNLKFVFYIHYNFELLETLFE